MQSVPPPIALEPKAAVHLGAILFHAQECMQTAPSGKALSRYFFRLVFPSFGLALEQSWTPRQICLFGQTCDKQSGAAPGPAQMARLTRTCLYSEDSGVNP